MTRSEILQELEVQDSLPTLPNVVMRVLELSRRKDVSIRDLKQVIITDPPLTAKVLSVANSAFFARRNKATTLDQAIVTIGLNELVTICTTMGVIQSLNVWEEKHLNREDLWRHSLSTAFLAKSLELRKGLADGKGPDLFLCGVLHNIGWIVLEQFFDKALLQLLERNEELDHWSTNEERAILGTDHADVGGMFLSLWKLPVSVVNVVQWHHMPERAGQHEAHAALLGLCSHIAPYSFKLEAAFERVPDSIPHRLEHKEGEEALLEMQNRYDQYIQQSKAMTDRMMDWI